MISHTEVARRYHLEIASDVIRLQRCRLSGVYAGRRDRVARHLELGPSDDLIILNRIRKVRTEGAPDDAPWIPALAETAYFAEARLPSFFYDDLHTGGRAVESISDYMKLHGIEVVNSEYRIRISPLTEPFHAPWAKLSGGVDVEHVKALRFLRFESVTHCHLARVQHRVPEGGVLRDFGDGSHRRHPSRRARSGARPFGPRVGAPDPPAFLARPYTRP